MKTGARQGLTQEFAVFQIAVEKIQQQSSSIAYRLIIACQATILLKYINATNRPAKLGIPHHISLAVRCCLRSTASSAESTQVAGAGVSLTRSRVYVPVYFVEMLLRRDLPFATPPRHLYSSLAISIGQKPVSRVIIYVWHRAR